MKCKVNDCYHRAFFYVMGIASETRANISQMFDFKNDWITPEGMHGGWQTSGTVKGCHFAFNLWNGYAEERIEKSGRMYGITIPISDEAYVKGALSLVLFKKAAK